VSALRRQLACDLLSSIALGIAVTSGGGILLDYPSLVTWNRGPGIALPTCVALICLSLTRLLRG
jgi:hypothetical protein